MGEQKHTPTPWKWSGRKSGDKETEIFSISDAPSHLCEPLAIIPCDDITEDSLAELTANAELIVRAVNSHAALVKFIESWRDVLVGRVEDYPPESWERQFDEEARAALALARKEPA